MKKLTAKEILERIKALFGEDISAYAHGDFTEAEGAPFDSRLSWEENEKNILEFIGLGKIEEVEQKGGTDEGSNWYSVKYFVDHDVYIKTIGYYQSYSGTDFHDGFGREVSPTEKIITVYK